MPIETRPWSATTLPPAPPLEGIEVAPAPAPRLATSDEVQNLTEEQLAATIQMNLQDKIAANINDVMSRITVAQNAGHTDEVNSLSQRLVTLNEQYQAAPEMAKSIAHNLKQVLALGA